MIRDKYSSLITHHSSLIIQNMIDLGNDILIKNLAGTTLISLGLNKDFEHSKELMGNNSISINFKLSEIVNLNRGTYIEYLGQKYALRTDYQPEEVSVFEYKYDLVFEALEMFFADITMFYTPQNLLEGEWTLTSNARAFMEIALSNINRYFGTTYKLGTVIDTEIKNISFANTNVFDGLTTIAENFNAEWYWDVDTLHLVEVYEWGEAPQLLERENNLTDIKRSNDNDTQYCTRLYAYGSTRNIPTNYRTPSEGEAVEAIVQKRLRLPASTGGYIDAYEDMQAEEVVELVHTFEEIYPHRIGTITSLRADDRTSDPSNPFIVYYFKDSTFAFDSSYILPNETLMIKFESGNLWGREFEMSYNNSTKEFEIINDQSNAALTIPNDVLRPQVGDKYALFNFDISLVSAEYIPAAEEELLQAATDYLSEVARDTATYECTCEPTACIEQAIDLEIGQRVLLKSSIFRTGEKPSRVYGYTKSLLNRNISTYTVGDVASYSRLREITEIATEAKTEASESVRQVDVLAQYTSRSYAQARESLEALNAAQLGFSQAIDPISVQTMQLIAGDKSLQFSFSPSLVVVWNTNDMRLNINGSTLTHQTLGIDTLKPSHSDDEKQKWTLPTWQSVALDNSTSATSYYIYAKCKIGSTTASDNTFLISEVAISMEQVVGYYHFLVGYLSTALNNNRVYTRYYGYANLTPGLLEIPQIQSSNGKLIIDLENARIIAEDGAEIIAPSITIAAAAAAAAVKTANNANTAAVSAVAKATALDYLKNATEAGQTTFQGGVVMSQIFGVTELNDQPTLENIKGGISGLKEDNIAFFADGKGAYEKAVQFLSDPTNIGNMLNFLVTDAGVAYMKNAKVLQGTFEDCYIEKGWFDEIGAKKADGTFDKRMQISAEKELWIYGKLQHQGADATFLAADMSIRGNFGVRSVNYVLLDRYGISYVNGIETIAGSESLYKVAGYTHNFIELKMYSPTDSTAGYAYNTIVIKKSYYVSDTLYCISNVGDGTSITIINAGDNPQGFMINQQVVSVAPKTMMIVTKGPNDSFTPDIEYKYKEGTFDIAPLGEGLIKLN